MVEHNEDAIADTQCNKKKNKMFCVFDISLDLFIQDHIVLLVMFAIQPIFGCFGIDKIHKNRKSYASKTRKVTFLSNFDLISFSNFYLRKSN